MGYLGNKLQGKYHKDTFQTAVNMAWPAIVESFFIAFAGLVDSLMVSSLGSYAVAAVGLTTQPKLLGLAFFFALNVSISALVARRRGEQRQGAANETLVTALVFIILAAAAFSVGFVAFASPIIHLCGSTAETHNGAVTYFRIIMGGMIFNCIQMGINSAQRGAGNTKITMRTNVTSNTINIILNYLLINGHFGFPALGIQGAALATVTGTVVGCVMSILSITKQDGFLNLGYILKNKIKPTIAAFISLVRVGYSVFFEQVFMRIGFMMTAIMAAKQGTDAMAAHQVGIAVCLVAIYLFGGRWLYSLFFEEQHIIEIGVSIIHVIIFVVIFQICQVIYMGCLRGAGDTLYTAVASMISVTFIRTIVSYLGGYTLGLGIVGIWFGVLADQMSRFIFATIRFKQGKWVKIKI
jgi:Na+-driven multidrug efflux pump